MYEPGQSIVLKDRQVLRGSVSAPSHCVSKRPTWLGDDAQLCDALPPTIQAHRRIIAQAFGVVHVLVSGGATVNGLTQQTDKPMAAVLARARIGERIACNHRQAAKLEHDVAVKSSLRAPSFDSPAGSAMTRVSMRE
jgi:hypothetical protein